MTVTHNFWLRISYNYQKHRLISVPLYQVCYFWNNHFKLLFLQEWQKLIAIYNNLHSNEIYSKIVHLSYTIHEPLGNFLHAYSFIASCFDVVHMICNIMHHWSLRLHWDSQPHEGTEEGCRMVALTVAASRFAFFYCLPAHMGHVLRFLVVMRVPTTNLLLLYLLHVTL